MLYECTLKVSRASSQYSMQSQQKFSKPFRNPKTVQPAPLGLLMEYLPNGCELWNTKGVA